MDQTRIVQLKNGLRLVCYRLPYRNIVSINVRANAGTRCEPEEASGIAHLVEHLLFQGTVQRPGSFAITQQVEGLGGEMLGATHTEYTSYWLNTPRNHLAQTLPIFLEMLRHPLFASESVEQEKTVILDEIAEAQEEGWRQAQTLLDQAIWADHPLGRSITGTRESISSISAPQIRDFFSQHYSPDRMVIAIVGDIAAEDIFPLFEQYWGDWNNPSASTQDFTPPQGRSPHPFLHQGREEGIVHLALGCKIPPLNHPDLGAYTVLRTLLGEGMSSRLYTALRGNAGLCYSLECGVDELRHASILTISIAMQSENILSIAECIRAIFQDLRAGYIYQQELERSRGQAIGQLLRQADDVMSQAYTLALSSYLTNTAVTLEKQLDQLARVDADSLRQAASITFRPENIYAGAIGPLTEDIWQQCQQVLTN